MEEKNEALEEQELEPSQEESANQEETPVKPAWQAMKESWYDKVPLTVKQLDVIIALGITGLVITFIYIILDAVGVF